MKLYVEPYVLLQSDGKEEDINDEMLKKIKAKKELFDKPTEKSKNAQKILKADKKIKESSKSKLTPYKAKLLPADEVEEEKKDDEKKDDEKKDDEKKDDKKKDDKKKDDKKKDDKKDDKKKDDKKKDAKKGAKGEVKMGEFEYSVTISEEII